MAPAWSLREELAGLLRRWHWLAGCFLLGGLLGWLAGLLLPAHYEATANLTVTFNSDAIYLSPDDYKNWQVAALHDFVLSDTVLSPVLDALPAGGDSWDGWTEADLRAVLVPRWRNAGAWQLAAWSSRPEDARVLVGAWREAVLAATAEAQAHAVSFNRLDRLLEARARSMGQVELAIADLRAVRAMLAAPAAGGAAEAARIRTRLAALPMGTVVLPELPEGAAAGEVDAWFAAAAGEVDLSLRSLEALRADLQGAYADDELQWLAELEAAHGLSAYLLVLPGSDAEIRVEPLHRSAELSLAGAVIGVLAFSGYRLGVLALHNRRETPR